MPWSRFSQRNKQEILAFEHGMVLHNYSAQIIREKGIYCVAHGQDDHKCT